MNKSTVIIYTDSFSPVTAIVQENLEKTGIHPEIKIVDKDIDAASEMYKLSQSNRVPVIRIIIEGQDDVVFVGYSEENKKKLSEILHISLPVNKVTYDW